MNKLMILLLLFSNFSFAQHYCKYEKSKINSNKSPIYSEEAGLFPIGQTLSKKAIQLEENGSLGSGINSNSNFIWSGNFLARYGLFKSMEIQSGVGFQKDLNLYPTYDFNKRYQFMLKQSLGEWFKTSKGGVPSSICLRYMCQESDSIYLKNHHLFGFSLNHSFYNRNWNISFSLIQYYSLMSDFLQTISVKAIRKTNNPHISLYGGYRVDYKAYKVVQAGIIYSDIKKNRFDISIGRILQGIFNLNLSYSYRI